MKEDKIYDCIVIGAGPGGLQASIYLGRFNREVLLIDRGGGRTWHARHIENFLTQKVISGPEIIHTGIEQAVNFNVKIEKGQVVDIQKKEYFTVLTKDRQYVGIFVIVATGAYDNLPPVANIDKFLGTYFFTCVDCDGYRTTGRKLVILGNSLKTVHLAIAMKEMFTKDITLVLFFLTPPDGYRDVLREEDIRLITGRPIRIVGDEKIEAVEMNDGSLIECEVVMSNFGYKLNDSFLSRLGLKKDGDDFKYMTNRDYESSISGLYILGPLTGNDQAIIAAGEGASAAIAINKRLLER